MQTSPSIFIFHPKNESFIRGGTGNPPELGLSPVKTMALMLVFFVMPAILMLGGMGFYLSNRAEDESLSNLIMLAMGIGFLAGISVIVYGLYLSINTFLKQQNLQKSGKLVQGQIQSIKFKKEHLDNEHLSKRNSDADYFIIAKIQYSFTSPQSSKTIQAKTQRRYMPSEVDANINEFAGKPCAVYYASDADYVLL